MSNPRMTQHHSISKADTASLRLAFVSWIALLACVACGGAQSATTTLAANGASAGTPPEHPDSPRAEERRPDPIVQREPTPDAPFRAQAPAPATTPPFTPPVIQRFRLANGMTVLLVERHELPIAVVRYVSRRGADDVADARSGLAQLVATLLEQGTSTHDAVQFAEQLATIGAEHGASVEWDSSAAFIKVTSQHLARAIELLADEVQRPAFAEADFARERSRQVDQLGQILRDAPHLMATVATLRSVYPAGHPYSRPLVGTMQGLAALTRNDVVQFHTTHFVPRDSALVVVGDVTRAALEPLLRTRWANWRVNAPRAAPTPTAQANTSQPRIAIIDRAGAPQSFVVLAHRGVARSSPDYIPISVMNTLLGGMFSSRINLNLREQHAYTYGARSGFNFRRGPGPFTAGGAMIAAHTGAALRELINEIERMRTSDIRAEELSAAQSRLVETLPSVFETGDSVAAAVSGIFVYALPLDEFATLTRRVGAVTIADVRRVANQYLDPANARIIIVGDRTLVTEQVRALDIGAVEYRAANGDIVSPAASVEPRPATSP